MPQRVIGRRVGSALIDLFLFWGAFWVVFLLVAVPAPSGHDVSGNPKLNLSLGDTTYYLIGVDAVAYLLVWVGAAFLWFGVLPGITGWTPGKLVTGLRVVGADGADVGVGRNLLRALAWLVDGFPYFLPGLVGFVLVLANKGRRVADRVANTYVVKGDDLAGSATVGSPAPAPAPAQQPAAGWYPDPGGQGQRWWDGAAWTEHRA